MPADSHWDRYCQYVCRCESIGLTLDISRMQFDDDFFSTMQPQLERAYDEMEQLEGGAIANPDEHRMVGHYWLRAPQLAPDDELREAITDTLARLHEFVDNVHSGSIAPLKASQFTRVLSIGIGGSALGPMFVHDALGQPSTADGDAGDKMEMHFIDNTDPGGVARTFDLLEGKLSETLCLVISKSGTTPETRNGMLLAEEAYERAGLDFGKHAVAVTGEGSQLDAYAIENGWLERFPMWDWVGGRTSETAVVGLLPAALQGVDIDALLAGAAGCDEVTRSRETMSNPAALMALMWHHATGGRGEKDMVVLPYCDRLLLFSRYLQQLIMESLGKRLDREGNVVEQGISVFGNKGSTDQHAYVQQLRDGINNFFVTFIQVLEHNGSTLEVETGVKAGDYLNGFLLGTRTALHENGRESMLVTIDRVDARTIGVLIALFERAVGYYASLININAYHQPGVQAGKDAANDVLALQSQIIESLSDTPRTAGEIATDIGSDQPELAYLILTHLAANGGATTSGTDGPAEDRFTA